MMAILDCIELEDFVHLMSFKLTKDPLAIKIFYANSRWRPTQVFKSGFIRFHGPENVATRINIQAYLVIVSQPRFDYNCCRG